MAETITESKAKGIRFDKVLWLNNVFFTVGHSSSVAQDRVLTIVPKQTEDVVTLWSLDKQRLSNRRRYRKQEFR
jgi:hypothetical protein